MSTLTNAPALTSISDLNSGWRHVCTQLGQLREWQGELTDPKKRGAYFRLIEDDRVIAVQRRLAEGHYRIFAKAAADVEVGPRAATAGDARKW